MPQGNELEALWDRFLLRFRVGYVTDTGFAKFIRAAAAKHNGHNSNGSQPLTLLQSELVALQQSAAQVGIPNAAIDLIEQLRRDLAGKGIIISDRRWRQTLGVLQAHALTEGRDAVTEDDLVFLKHVLWQSPEQQAEIGKAISLNELAAMSQGAERAEQLKKEAAQAKADAEKRKERAERLSRKLEDGSEERLQQVRRAVRKGLAEAMAEIEQANDAIKAFGGGYDIGFGMENGAGGRNLLSTKDKLAIAQRVGKSPRLQQIAAICGRFTRIALQQQKTRVKHPPDEITLITTGNQIERLLPSEIALLAEPDLEDLFYLKFAERSLTQYDLIGHEPQWPGPIIIAIDESGSMTSDYGGASGEVWSKAVTLALLSIARLQKRDFAVIHFSGPDDLRLDLFPKGEATPAQVIACADFFFNGGTVFEPWMNMALELVDESQFEKADVICVSDGIAAISPEARAEWTKRKADRGMRAYGILIGSGEGEVLLGEIADAVFHLDDLRDDLPALETIFSIGS